MSYEAIAAILCSFTLFGCGVELQDKGPSDNKDSGVLFILAKSLQLYTRDYDLMLKAQVLISDEGNIFKFFTPYVCRRCGS